MIYYNYKKNLDEKIDLSVELGQNTFRLQPKMDQFVDRTQIQSKIIGKWEQINWIVKWYRAMDA